MLENIRFNEGEESSDSKFSKKLSNLGDIYVNDAFSCSHRAHASIEEITKYIPSYAGLLFEREYIALSGVIKSPEHPFVIILGGGPKTSDKMGLIKNFLNEGINLTSNTKFIKPKT